MRCPYCGDRRTEVLKTVYRGAQFVPASTMRLLWLPLQYPRTAGALEPRGTEVAGTATITERME